MANHANCLPLKLVKTRMISSQ